MLNARLLMIAAVGPLALGCTGARRATTVPPSEVTAVAATAVADQEVTHDQVRELLGDLDGEVRVEINAEVNGREIDLENIAFGDGMIIMEIDGERHVIDLAEIMEGGGAHGMVFGTGDDARMMEMLGDLGGDMRIERHAFVNGEEVDFAGGTVIIDVNGDRREIDLGELMEHGDGHEMVFEVIVEGDEAGFRRHEIHRINGNPHEGPEMHRNGDGDRGDMRGRIEEWMHHIANEWEDRMRHDPESMGEWMHEMHDNFDRRLEHMPEEWREMAIDRMEDLHRRFEHAMGEHDDRGHEGGEEREFMEQVHGLAEMSQYLWEHDAMAILGVTMIREHLEPEAQVEALGAIRDETVSATATWNAATLVLLEALGELEDVEAATEVLVEFVIANSHRSGE